MSTPPLPPEILAYYAAAREAERLSLGHGPLEAERTRELLLRHLPPAPGVVLDVGGGPGAYACWLAGCGYGVHLVDSAPLHVEQAREASARQPDRPLASVGLGDARRLDMPDASVDAVLLMGPLYHLTERGERIVALREAWRVLRRGGLVFAVGISRFASLFSGLTGGLLGDPAAATIVADDLRTGQHRNPTSRHEWFTTAYFHRPEEMPAEVHEAGFQVLETVGVEGPGWVLPDVATRWADPAAREHLLMAARAAEREPTLLGVSAHMMVVGRRPPASMRWHALDHEQAGAAMSDRRRDVRGDPGVAAPRSHPIAEADGLAGGRPGLRRGARQARGDAGAGHGGGGLCGGDRGAAQPEARRQKGRSWYLGAAHRAPLALHRKERPPPGVRPAPRRGERDVAYGVQVLRGVEDRGCQHGRAVARRPGATRRSRAVRAGARTRSARGSR